MARFPVIFEHMDAIGVLHGELGKTSVLSATSAILVARGADQIIVPAPSANEKEGISEGIASLPPERRSLVKLVDEKGTILARIRNYLTPLESQANKWPEDAFISFSEGFLYQLALGSKYHAGILDSPIVNLREFIPLLNPLVFSGEARYRFAELISLICSYEPVAPEHYTFREDAVLQPSTNLIWSLLDSTEFRAITAASGRIGYLKHPSIALRRLRKLLAELIKKTAETPILRLAHIAAEVSGAASGAECLPAFVENTTNIKSAKEFWPPFIGLGPASMGVYRVALLEKSADAHPPEGTIMIFEKTRAGKNGRSWLNEGEEDKLESEAAQGLGSRQEQMRKAREAQQRFFR